jgi:hypothetical protein
MMTCFANHLEYFVDMVQGLLIGEADYSITMLDKLFCSILVLFELIFVNRAIDFNHQVVFGAVEISDVWTQRSLPAEFQTI